MSTANKRGKKRGEKPVCFCPKRAAICPTHAPGVIEERLAAALSIGASQVIERTADSSGLYSNAANEKGRRIHKSVTPYNLYSGK